jgi:hypothetical protein
MLRQYVPVRHRQAPEHQPGEVVLAALGNYLEEGADCSRKVRPLIILRATSGQHVTASLTTQATYKTTATERPELPDPVAIGLDGRRPSRICRLDVRQHLGWITTETVDFLAVHLHLDQTTLASLWALAQTRARSRGGSTSCDRSLDGLHHPSQSDGIGQSLRPRQPR